MKSDRKVDIFFIGILSPKQYFLLLENFYKLQITMYLGILELMRGGGGLK